MRNSNRISSGQRRVLIYYFNHIILRMALLIFCFGTFYYFYAQYVGEPLENIAKAYYLVLTLIFLNPIVEFPKNIVLQLCFFVMPILGISLLAQGLEKFGKYLFNPKELSKDQLTKELERLIPRFRRHTIVVGMGQLGSMVVKLIHQTREPIVVLESEPEGEWEETIIELGIPIILDDPSKESALIAAGVQNAKSIVFCTSNDEMNLQIALKARNLNPIIQVVIQIFDEDFAHLLQEQFGFTALSATEMAAPVFAAAAAGADVTNPISIEGQQLSLARLTIQPSSHFVDKTIGYVEDNYHLNIILLRHDHQSEMHPTDTRPLHAGDTLAVLGGPEQLSRLMQDNQ